MRTWTTLLIAGLLEVGWAVGIKYTDGFRRIVPSVLTVSAMLGSVGLLGICIRSLPLGTAYAVWTGIGVIGTVVFGITVLGEALSWIRVGCLLMIVIGVVGLRMSHT